MRFALQQVDANSTLILAATLIFDRCSQRSRAAIMHNEGVASTLYPENGNVAAYQPPENARYAAKANQICRKFGK
jgi:hypothetical protein